MNHQLCDKGTLWAHEERPDMNLRVMLGGGGGGGWEWYSIHPLLTSRGQSHSFAVCSNPFFFSPKEPCAVCFIHVKKKQDCYNQPSSAESLLRTVYDGRTVLVKQPSFHKKTPHRPGVFRGSNTVIISHKWKQMPSWSPYFPKQWKSWKDSACF